MSDDEQELTDEEIEELQDILESNREVGANEYTMRDGEDDED